MPANTSTSESAIRFFRSGGHKHDGVSSSLIDFSKYSIFDFGTDNTTSGQDAQRDITRQNNQNRFNQYIANFISTQILAPAGIELLENSVRGVHIGANEITANNIAANTITANEIASNTITAAELAINVVQVGDTISSSNYVLGTTGWQIRSNGSAEFNNNIIVRGQIEATSGNFTGNINAGGTFANGSVSNGAITGGSLTIGTDPNVFKVYSNGSMSLGDGTFLSAPFRVTNGGALTAASGSIGGWTISSTTLSGGTTTLYSNGYIVATGSSFTDAIQTGGRIVNGNNFGGYSSGDFNTSIFQSYANGYIKSILGSVGGFTISSTNLVRGNMTIDGALVVKSGANGTIIQDNKIYFKYNNSVAATMEGYQSTFNGLYTDVYLWTAANCNLFNIIPTVGANTNIRFTGIPIVTGVAMVRNAASGQIGVASSLRALKENITPINIGTTLIKKLKPVTYNWRSNVLADETERYLKSINTQYGFIVEEIEEIDRGLVHYSYNLHLGEDDEPDFTDPKNFSPQMYDSNGILSIAVSAIKEILERLEVLESRQGV